MVGDPDDHRPGSTWALLVDPGDDRGRVEALAVISERIGPGERIPLHVHRVDEVILPRGPGRFRLGEEEQTVDDGAVVFIPAGVPHGLPQRRRRALAVPGGLPDDPDLDALPGAKRRARHGGRSAGRCRHLRPADRRRPLRPDVSGSSIQAKLARGFDPAELRRIKRLWVRHRIAEDRRDIDGLIATLSPDCTYEIVVTGQRWEGHDGARRFYGELFAAFPDNAFALSEIVVGPQGVFEVATLTGTNQGRGRASRRAAWASRWRC